MDEDEDLPPRVPAPREGGLDEGEAPSIPAPRAAPALECLPRGPGAVATMADRVGSSALVRVERGSTALALRDDSVPSRLRALGHDVARLVVHVVGATVQGVRSLFESFWPCPAVRRRFA